MPSSAGAAAAIPWAVACRFGSGALLVPWVGLFSSGVLGGVMGTPRVGYGGVYLLATSQSRAHLAAKCFAAFFVGNRGALSSTPERPYPAAGKDSMWPVSWARVSPIVTRQTRPMVPPARKPEASST